MNRRKLEWIVADSRAKNGGMEPLLIQPTEKPIPHNRDFPHPFGAPVALPGIACVGRFHSVEPARDLAKDCSQLVVIWFQEEFAFPIDPLVTEQLQGIDWERLACDLEY
jgi:hypothetical protein